MKFLPNSSPRSPRSRRASESSKDHLDEEPILASSVMSGPHRSDRLRELKRSPGAIEQMSGEGESPTFPKQENILVGLHEKRRKP
jgi:hypothetical protein